MIFLTKFWFKNLQSAPSVKENKLLLSNFCIPKCRTFFHFFTVYSCRLFYFLIFKEWFLYFFPNLYEWELRLWKTMLFHDKLKSYFLVYIYWIASSGITKIYIFSKYFWSPCSTDENHFDFVFLLGSLTTSIWYHVDVLLKTCLSVK